MDELTTAEIWFAGIGASLIAALTAAGIAFAVARYTIAAERTTRERERRAEAVRHLSSIQRRMLTPISEAEHGIQQTLEVIGPMMYSFQDACERCVMERGRAATDFVEWMEDYSSKALHAFTVAAVEAPGEKNSAAAAAMLKTGRDTGANYLLANKERPRKPLPAL